MAWWLAAPFLAPGQVTETNYKTAADALEPDRIAKTYHSSQIDDENLIAKLREQEKNPPPFSGIFHNCQWWTLMWIDYRGDMPNTIPGLMPVGSPVMDRHVHFSIPKLPSDTEILAFYTFIKFNDLLNAVITLLRPLRSP